MQHGPGCLGAATLIKRSCWGRMIAHARSIPCAGNGLDLRGGRTKPRAAGDGSGRRRSAAPPMSMSEAGDVGYFSQDLGTILRLRFSTESYGQDGNGNFDIGSMQVVTMDDTEAFLDGQVTMNESDGVGFNVGLGYRWMSYPFYSADSGRMEGVSLWADGTHTDAGNFFPQVGISYESLGEMWDVRANGYIPLGQREQVALSSPRIQSASSAIRSIA